ncbi:MAG: hypothetical protein HDR95_03750 [Bacteroides sp.]|nr:hypothetical protein [Bacteroides sp.]
MKKTEHKYQFTAMPVNLTVCLDNNCRSMLFTLLQLSSYYADEDGWFFRSNADLQAQSRLSENLVRATISTLYRLGVIDVRIDGKSKSQSPNHFKVNETAMLQWERYSIEDCIKNPDYAIMTDQYRTTGWKPSYLGKSAKATAQSQQSLPEIEDNIDNAANEENTDYILSAGAHERISTKPREFHSPAMAEYKKEEDAIMERLQKATSWLDFDKITRDVDKILINPPSEKAKECTYQRLQALTASKIPYFIKKYQSEPDNPIGMHFFKWLDDVWGKLHGDAT